MTNFKYNRSRAREYQVLHEQEEEGYLSFRTAGSHGIADVIAIKPAKDCPDPYHYEVKLIQIKTNKKIKGKSVTIRIAETIIGAINVIFYYFPVRKNAKSFSSPKSTKRVGVQRTKTRI